VNILLQNELLGRTSSVALQIAWGVIPLGSLLVRLRPPAERVTPLGASRALHRGAQVGREGGQVEQVQQRVAPPLPRRPFIEMPQALVGRVQDRP
jgi:hypothetical protein